MSTEIRVGMCTANEDGSVTIRYSDGGSSSYVEKGGEMVKVFDKQTWMREYMREYRRGMRRRKSKSTPPQPIKGDEK